MRNRYKYILSGVVVLLASVLTCCIKNDLPYPKIPQIITKLKAEGEIKASLIDSMAYDVTVYLDETVDIENVKFTEFAFTPGAECNINLLEGTYNLSSPMNVELSKYQTYNWIIYGKQDIERYFTIDGQIGESVIDPIGHRVIISMPEGTDLSSLTLLSAKLGPKDITTMVPDLKPGRIDLSYPLRVAVTAHGRAVIWTIYVVFTDLVVSTTSVDAWSQVIWAYGNCPSDMKGGFEYREAGATEWIPVPQERVIQNQGAFSCSIPHLKPLTQYSVRATGGTDKGNEVKVTTQSTADIPNGDFEDWCQIGKIIYPYAEGGEQFWDTGNTGSSTLGQNLTVSSDNTPAGSGKSAECTTKFVGIGVVGKLGAGSIFTGKFRKVDGTNGILDFGRPWTLRPTKLKGYFQYKAKDIDYASTELAEMKGRPDTCIVYVAVTDWTAPYEIRTNPKNRILFDKDASYVIGYGQMQYSGNMDSFKEFVIDINYKNTSKIPSYLQITCATSKYGDYFTGGNGSVMWVDQLSFGWDLE